MDLEEKRKSQSILYYRDKALYWQRQAESFQRQLVDLKASLAEEEIPAAMVDITDSDGHVNRILDLLALLMARPCTRKEIFAILKDYNFIEGSKARAADKKLERDIRLLKARGYRVATTGGGRMPVTYRIRTPEE